jgi:hypothetical protein
VDSGPGEGDDVSADIAGMNEGGTE